MARFPNWMGVSSPATATDTSHEADGINQKQREQFKVAIWTVSSFLFLSLAWHAGAEELMPPEFVFLLWTSSELLTIGGCYWLFIYRVPDSIASGNIMRGVLWVFAAALNVVFPLQNMKSFPPALSMIVFLKSGFVIIGVFYRLFLSRVAPHLDPILPR